MITTSITRSITSRIASAIAGARAGAARWYLHWDGVDQYATHSAWSMSGFGDKIEFSFVADAPGTGDDYLFDSTDGENYLKVANTTAVLTLGFLDTDAVTSRTITGPTVVAGTTYAGYVEFKADGVDLVVSGTTYGSASVPAIKDDLTHIAAETTPGSYFNGTFNYLRYVNATAIQDTYANMGGGNRYGELEQAIVLSSDEEWTIDIDMIFIGAVTWKILGNLLGGTNGPVRIQSVDRLDIIADDNSSVAATTTFAKVEEGQHIKLSIRNRVFNQTSIQILVDDSEVSINTAATSKTYTIGAIGGPINLMRPGSTVQNIVIKDLTNNLTWNYPLDEGSGTDIINSDPSTGSDYNGAWTPDTDWQFMPQLSRIYKMNDGPDATELVDSLGDGTTNATLFNVDPEDWSR